MSHLQVSSSIISVKALEAFLQPKYNFEKTITLQLLKAGVNHSYLLTDGEERYVFRIYTFGWRSKKEIAAEVNLLQKLSANGIGVSYSIPTQEGHSIIEIPAPEGPRYGVLFSFAKGEKQLVLSEEAHSKIGRIMAEFHQLTLGDTIDRVTYTAQNILVDSLPKIQQFLHKETDEMQWMMATQQELLTLWENADERQIRKGTVHLDLWSDNLHITMEGEVTLFDFDFCGNGWQCLDLAYYILQLHSTEKDETIRQSKVQAFLAGYESVVLISDEERRLLPMLGVSLYYFYLGVQSERFDNWSNVFLSETYLKRFIQILVKGYYSNHF